CSCASNHTGLGGDGGPTPSGLAGSGGSGGLGGAVYAASAVRLNDCTFSGNLAGSGGQGGSVPNPGHYIYPYGPGGGGIGGSGGALYCQSDLEATNCTLNDNQAGRAGDPGAAGFNPSMDGQSSPVGSNGGDAGAIFGVGPLFLHACT